MKKLLLLSVVISALSVTSSAQKGKVEPLGEPQAGPTTTSAASSLPEKPLVVADAGLEATLVSSLDVRRSKPGDEVVLKTTKHLKQNGAIVIPKGSKIIGRITEVQQKGKSNTASKLGLLFERIEGKGLSSPITASIISVTDLRTTAAISDTAMGEIAGTSRTRAGSASGGSRGGLLGGVGSTVGGVLNGSANTVGSVTGPALNTTGSALGTAGGALRGIQLNQSASGSAAGSAVLTANDKNLKLEKGITFGLLVSGSAGN